ncbi:MAG: hypothetical protein U9N59_03495 [Campylobacterota bacterium]|nr:hypothetical protein [Campylobacterota bacterium]
MGLFDIFKKKNDDFLSEEEKEAKLLMEQGMNARINNDYEKALNYFNKSLEIKEHPSVYLNRGAIYQIYDLYLQAKLDYLRAIEIEDTNPTLFKNETIKAATENLNQIEIICNKIEENGEKMRNSIYDDGIDYAAKRIAEITVENFLINKEDINYFILCELKVFYELGGVFKMFTQNTGINDSLYHNPTPSINVNQDKQNNAFYYTRQVWGSLNDDLDTVTRLRLKIIELLISKSSYNNN